jgi:ribosome biogenesis protein MAK21
MESKNMETRFYRSLYAALFDARLASTSKQSMFLNLLLKSMKRDQNSERLIAFIRRLLASLICGPVAGDCAFGCGALFVIGEVSAFLFGNLFCIPASQIMKERTVLQTAVSPSKRAGEEGYDPRKREPEFSRAEGSPSWEFVSSLGPFIAFNHSFDLKQALLSRHFHPSIQLHAAQILSGTKVTANADLSLNTLSHFLDRYLVSPIPAKRLSKSQICISESKKARGSWLLSDAAFVGAL